MGLIHADIELAHARQDEFLPMAATTLVDSGAPRSCVPRHVAHQIELPVPDRREATVADGKRRTVDHAGPVKIRFVNRQCLVGAPVVSDQALFGAIPMEDRDFVISPARQTVTVNPASPTIAASMAMGFRSAHP